MYFVGEDDGGGFGFAFDGANGAGALTLTASGQVERGFDGEDAGRLEVGREDAIGSGDTLAVVVVALVTVLLIEFNHGAGNRGFGGFVDYQYIQIAVGVVIARGEKGNG